VKEKQYLALLRGINVGGNNVIKMAKLKESFEKLGFSDIATYIQSGNVLFKTSEKNLKKVAAKIEKALSKEYKYVAKIILFSYEELKTVVERAPKKFGKDPSKYRYDVLFLREPVDETKALKSIPLKEGVDQGYAGKRVLYFSRLISKATQSKLARIILLPIYQEMTIRNWNTTTKLLVQMNEREK
jgi:uncharacterized protein (DUF1697 family)